ncbi:MAG: phosphorylase [Clostridia bacterium]|nr:phosphorylase [Clostridia bacterium]
MDRSVYNYLIDGNKKYSSGKAEMCESNFKCEPDEIQEKVIIAPTWEVDIFSGHVDRINHVSGTKKHDNIISEITIGENKVTFITTNVGACRIFDVTLALRCTPCKEILFIGSAGALDMSMKIGDIVIPEYSVCGVGTNRYLTVKDVIENDCYGERYYPDKAFSDKLRSCTNEIIKDTDIKTHIGRNFSVDTIFAQFAHLEEFINMGCNTIEMETSTFFQSAEVAGIKAAALFNISDNTVTKKSLYSGRTDEDQVRRKNVKKNIIPKIVLKALDIM